MIISYFAYTLHSMLQVHLGTVRNYQRIHYEEFNLAANYCRVPFFFLFCYCGSYNYSNVKEIS